MSRRKARVLRDQRIHSLVASIIGAASDGDTGSWFWVDIAIEEPRHTVEESIARGSANRLQAFLRAGTGSVPADAVESLSELCKIVDECSWWERQTFHLALNKAVAFGLQKGQIHAKMTADFGGRRIYTLSVES